MANWCTVTIAAPILITGLTYLLNFLCLSGSELTKPQIYDMLYNTALYGDKDCGGIVTFNYFSGELWLSLPQDVLC